MIEMVCATDKIRQAAAAFDGVLVVNKEAGWTSHDVVAKVRGLLGGARVGHAGTLDPAATGVLPLLIGRATRIAEYLMEWDKDYRAVLRLGETTDTQDATGIVLERCETGEVTDEQIRRTVERFRGAQKQTPPMYSAVKVGGRPLYKAARAGQTVHRDERPIVVHSLEIAAVDGRDVTLDVVCSKGTYIRTLCADIGQALGVGGHLLALERRRVGPLTIEQALTIDQVATLASIGTLKDRAMTLDQALERLPAVVVTGERERRVLHGAPIDLPEPARFPGGTTVRLKDDAGRLLAIGICEPQPGDIRIQKVLGSQERVN
jgi:tRNA pseudouridine55 synthase